MHGDTGSTGRSMHSSNTAATSTSPESARPNAHQERPSAHAEELASRLVAFSQQIGGSMNSSNTTATSTSPEGTRPNAYHERTSAHAEELANRLIAFSQLAAAGAERREQPEQHDSSVPSLPIPILKPPSRTSSNGTNFRKAPPPPPPRRLSNTEERDSSRPLRTRSRSIDVSNLEKSHSRGSDLDKSSSFIRDQKSIKSSDFNASSASIHKSKDLGNSSASLSSSRDFSSRDLNKASTDIEPRKVRVTQFSDEPDVKLESSDSLPNHCDKKGRCRSHSNIRLYKRHLLGGYSLVMEKCPLCETSKEQTMLEVSPRPTIVIKRSTSAGRARLAMEKKPSAEYVRSASLERKSSLERRSLATKGSLLETVKSSKKGIHEIEASSSQPETALLDESNQSINYANCYDSSEKHRIQTASPVGRAKLKLTRKAMSENEAWRARGGTTFLEESNRSNNYVDYINDSEMKVSRIASPVGKARHKLSTNVMSESETSRLREGTTFLEESNRSRGAPPPYLKSPSLEYKASSKKNSPIISQRPTLSRKETSASAFLDDVRHKHHESGPVSDNIRTGSGSTVSSSPNESPGTPSTRPKLSLRRASDLSADNNQAPTSMLEKGLEKLSLLGRKGRSSSRGRGVSDASTIKSLGSRARSEYSDTTSGIVSLGQNPKPIQKSKPKRRQWDSTGRCKKHPSIILARKRPFGNGWDKLRECCPMCEETKSEISTSKMNHLLGRDKSPSPSDFNASLHLREQISSAPSELNTTRLTQEPIRSKSRGKMDRSNRSDFRRSNNRLDSMSQQVPRVQKMPYTTPSGETGWYTGEVNEKGHPNGQGRMRMKTGNVVEGQWANGYSEQYIENEKRIKSGFGSNIAPWKQSTTSPQYESHTNSTRTSQAQRAVSRESHFTSRPSQGLVQPHHQYNNQMPSHSQWQNQAYPQQQHQPAYSTQQLQSNYNAQQYQPQSSYNAQQQQPHGSYNTQQQQQWQQQQGQYPDHTGMLYGQMPSQQNTHR